jgi:hypothetical protein
MKIRDIKGRVNEGVQVNENPWNQRLQKKPGTFTLPAPPKGTVDRHGRKFKVGDIVVPHTGPHAGVPHKVVWARVGTVSMDPMVSINNHKYDTTHVRARHEDLSPYDASTQTDGKVNEADVPGSPYNGMDRETRQIYQNLLYHGGGGSWTAQKAAQAAKNRTALAASADYHVYTQADVKADSAAASAKYKEVAALFNKEKAKPASDVGQKRRMMALKKAGDELSNFPRYLGNQAWAEDGYSAIFSGKTPWEELSEMAKANVVRKQAQIKKKKEAINALMTKIGVSPIVFTNMGDVAESVTEGSDDGFVRVSSTEFDRIAQAAGAEWVYNMGALMLNGEEVGYRREVDRERDRIWYDYYVRSDLMQGSGPNTQLGDAREVITQPIGSITKRRGSNELELGEDEVERMADRVHANYLFSMTKTDYDNPANSDTKYFKMVFTVPQGGVAHPLALNRQIEENPVYRDLRKQGYEGAKTIAMWKNDIDSELAAAHDKLNDPRPWLPSYKQELTKTVNTLSMAKKIMSSNEVLEGVREASNPQDVIRKFLDQKLSQERRAADLAKNPQKVNQMKSDEILQDDTDSFDPVTYVGARVAKAGKYSSLRDPNKRTRDEEDAIARKLAAKSKAKPVREVAGYAANGATLLVAQNGKVVQKLQLPLDPKMHHIAQELRKLNLGLNDFEMTSAARDLAGGRTYRKGTLAMQMKASTPTEMR